MEKIKEKIVAISKAAREASHIVAGLSTSIKNDALKRMADALLDKRRDIIEANQKDVVNARTLGLSTAMIDRLTLTEKVLNEIAASLQEVVMLPDPVGEVTGMWMRPNGLQVGRMRIPLGVIGFIYESRPNVTVDAASLCLKSGNVVILKGGSEAINSNMALASVLQEAISSVGIPEAAIQVIPFTEREAVSYMLELEEDIDLIIPRGGEGLIRYVTQNATMPVLKHYKGVCHVYVDKYADIEMAKKICMNAKVQRPGVCNAMETLLVHKEVSVDFLPVMSKDFEEVGVELRGCEKSRQIVPGMKEAKEEDWEAEYLDLILAVKIVDSMDEAISHILKYGSNHTESIITKDYNRARAFLREVDSSVVLVNASTRFNDGFQLGLGAEIGINTSKLHAFGPMGLKELTTTKFIVFGDGQIRE